jgi:hypothetical protein
VRPLVPLMVVSAVALSGCAGERTPQRAAPPVRITLTSPRDLAVVRDGTVEVRGTVNPAEANVSVLGEPATVTGGTFVARVALAEGANVVDVAATARGSSPGLAALRITREVRIIVPDLLGKPADDALGALDKLGLEAREERGGGLFDGLLPGERHVCATDPRGGTQVKPGSPVRVVTAKSC